MWWVWVGGSVSVSVWASGQAGVAIRIAQYAVDVLLAKEEVVLKGVIDRLNEKWKLQGAVGQHWMWGGGKDNLKVTVPKSDYDR